MKVICVLILAALLAACGGSRPALPSGVTCTDEQAATIHSVPPKADPSSAEYDGPYAMGWYVGHGCDLE